jgi:hypothetical protein
MNESGTLELVAEHRPLSDQENDTRKELSLKLEKIWRIEEIKAR